MDTLQYIAQWNANKSLKKRLRLMSPEVFHLITTGRLMASEREQYDFLPHMGCAYCGAPTDMIFNHEPIDYDAKDTKFSLKWGEDVTVVCRCCSFSKCTHKAVAA